MGRPTISHLLIALILLAGLAVRLQGLGAAPLSEAEAQLAVQARSLLAGGGESDPGAHPGYAALTGLLFFLFGETDFIARLVPALAGSLLVLAPWILRDRLGTPAALLLSAGLALDPILVGVSRLADGPMFAAGALGLAISLRIANISGPDHATRRAAAGILAALALLAGPPVWLGLTMLLVAWIAGRVFGLRLPDREPLSYRSPEAIGFGLALILAGTLFLRAPSGLGAFGGSIGVFLGGFIREAAVPALWLLIALAGYQGFIVLFAAVHSWRVGASARPADRAAWVFLLAGVTVLVFYRGRAVSDLVWVVLPLWVLAAAGIAAVLGTRSTPVYRPGLLALILVILMISFWVNLASFSNTFLQDPNLWLRVMVLVGTLVLAGLSAVLVGLGWEPDSAKSGIAWALVVLIVFGLLKGIFGGSHLASPERRDLWLPSPLAGETGLLADTLHDLGGWSAGSPLALDVVQSTESPSVDWVLREFPNVTRTASLSREDLPGIVITESDSQGFRFESAYRGQGLTWRVRVLWNEMTGSDWLRWMLFKEAPAVSEQLIVWARADLFLTGGEVVQEDLPVDSSTAPVPEELVPLEDVEEIFPDG